MSTSWKQQALIEAPLGDVWSLISDPARYPEIAGDVIEVTGVPTKVEVGSTFLLTSRGPLGTKPTTKFMVEALDDLREIKVRCQTSGYYSRWALTEARGNTFADLELGFEPIGLTGRAIRATTSKRYLRRMTEGSFDAVRRILGRSKRD